jgi:FlaA1/EpsC-like NDP-sugar epimerase
MSQADSGELPITDIRMTRFMITLEQAVELSWHAFDDMYGGEIYVKKLPSMTITDIAQAVSSNAKHRIIGIRPGEKIDEQMIGIEDAPYTYEFSEYYKILPAIHDWSNDPARNKGGSKVASNFTYNSRSNLDWMSISQLKEWININKKRIGKI